MIALKIVGALGLLCLGYLGAIGAWDEYRARKLRRGRKVDSKPDSEPGLRTDDP